FNLRLKHAWLLALLASCSSPPTEAIITIDAEPGVRAQAASLGVHAWGSAAGATGIPMENMRYVQPFSGSALQWPRTIAIAPLDGDPSRQFRMEATAYTGADET